MSPVPENLLRLHDGEETLWLRNLALVEASPDLADHLDLTECVMDGIGVLRQTYTATDDERTISHLGLRVFNLFATAWKLAAAGYCQLSAQLLRDIIEISNLVLHCFQIDSSQVARWRTADDRTRKRDSSPAPVRKALGDYAGKGRSKCEEIYKKFSSLAGHPTVVGFAMLRPQGMDAQIGPFSDLTALRAVLEEMGMLAAQAGFAFCPYLDTTPLLGSDTPNSFLVGAMDFSGKYLGRVYSPA